MNAQEWLELFERTNDKFRWFFLQYGFGTQWTLLIEIKDHSCECKSDDDRMNKMLSIMNHVWFCLPDNTFNIMNNPKGWSEFLNLIEQ